MVRYWTRKDTTHDGRPRGGPMQIGVVIEDGEMGTVTITEADLSSRGTAASRAPEGSCCADRPLERVRIIDHEDVGMGGIGVGAE
jgi:hypothetical protein